MATSAGVTRMIDTGLRDIAAESEFLPDLALRWPHESDDNRSAWYLEWRELMARLAHLDHVYRDGAMSAVQRTRYRVLLHELEQALPIIDRLGFTRPPISLAGGC